MHALPKTEEEIDAFLAAFEDGTLPKHRWTHGAHLLTGACYVHSLGETAAIERMRERVSAYNLAVGGQNTDTGGYHETVTLFWIKLIARTLADRPKASRAAFAHSIVAEFEPRRGILAEYYGFDVAGSREARREWVAPDLREM